MLEIGKSNRLVELEEELEKSNDLDLRELSPQEISTFKNFVLDFIDKLTEKNQKEQNKVTFPEKYKKYLKEFKEIIKEDQNNFVQLINKMNKYFGLTPEEPTSVSTEIFFHDKENSFIIKNNELVEKLNYRTNNYYNFNSKQIYKVFDNIFSELNFDVYYYGKIINNKLEIIKIVIIHSLFIYEKYKRKGIGTSLFNFLKNKLNATVIIIESPVLTAQPFYFKQNINLLTDLPVEIYNYIKDELHFELAEIREIYPNLHKIEDILSLLTSPKIMLNQLILKPEQNNVAGYFKDIYIRGIKLYISNGIWVNNQKLSEISSPTSQDKDQFIKPKFKFTP